jgi:signal transduction histidine kinase
MTPGILPWWKSTFPIPGVGISKKDQKSIYEYFYTTKPPGKGTGLGLPISRDIIKNLGGSISFVSEPGEGTTFTVRSTGFLKI